MLYMVSPALIGVLGMFPHTHRQLLRTNWKSLLCICTCSAPLGFVFTAVLAGALNLPLEVTASALPATTTTGLALTMNTSLTMAKYEWIAFGPLFCGVGGMIAWPFLFRLCGLPIGVGSFARGFSLGSVSHIAGQAALLAAGNAAAADAASISFFLLGILRCLFLQIPGFEERLMRLATPKSAPKLELAPTQPARDSDGNAQNQQQ